MLVFQKIYSRKVTWKTVFGILLAYQFYFCYTGGVAGLGLTELLTIVQICTEWKTDPPKFSFPSKSR